MSFKFIYDFEKVLNIVDNNRYNFEAITDYVYI